MRDIRFIARHRGGPLSKEDHRLLAAWAADCAERVLDRFEKCVLDDRPRIAIEAARAWSRGEVPVGAGQKAAVAAHAAAREAGNPVATAAARAAGHAAATAHMADHCLGAAHYALKAVDPSLLEAERQWQIKRLPVSLLGLVTSALEMRNGSHGPANAPPRSRSSG